MTSNTQETFMLSVRLDETMQTKLDALASATQRPKSFFVVKGAVVSYSNQPLKYDLAQLAQSGSSYVFQTSTVDTTESRLSYLVKFIFNVEIMGGLNPSIGYGVENLDIKNNLTSKSASSDKTLISFGFEKRF